MEESKQQNPKPINIDSIHFPCTGLNDLAHTIYQNNKEKGFWDKKRNVGEMLMLITSELGEAMEAHRKGRFAYYDSNPNDYDDWKTWFIENYKDTFEDEIADAMIRLLDMIGGLAIDIETHIKTKLQYNKTRERLHGKLY